jgi:hypothetical protein
MIELQAPWHKDPIRNDGLNSQLACSCFDSIFHRRVNYLSVCGDLMTITGYPEPVAAIGHCTTLKIEKRTSSMVFGQGNKMYELKKAYAAYNRVIIFRSNTLGLPINI